MSANEIRYSSFHPSIDPYSFFRDMPLRLLDYEVTLSTAYHPQTDGQTECLNQELETYLRIYCCFAPLDWIKHLSMAGFFHNH
jgi:hypothetical protein